MPLSRLNSERFTSWATFRHTHTHRLRQRFMHLTHADALGAIWCSVSCPRTSQQAAQKNPGIQPSTSWLVTTPYTSWAKTDFAVLIIKTRWSAQSLRFWVHFTSRDRHYGSSWRYQSAAYDLPQTARDILDSCRQGPCVTNSHIIYWKEPSTFSHAGR